MATTTASFTGKTTVDAAGTAEQLSDIDGKLFAIKALAGNTGIVYLGGSDVSSANGLELSAGEGVVVDMGKLPGTSVSILYVDAATNDDGVTVMRLA